MTGGIVVISCFLLILSDFPLFCTLSSCSLFPFKSENTKRLAALFNEIINVDISVWIVI